MHRLVKADFFNPTSRGGESLLKIFWKKSALRDKIIVDTIIAILSRLIVAVILNWLI